MSPYFYMDFTELESEYPFAFNLFRLKTECDCVASKISVGEVLDFIKSKRLYICYKKKPYGTYYYWITNRRGWVVGRNYTDRTSVVDAQQYAIRTALEIINKDGIRRY